jgi:hypothetical protein
MPRRWFRHSAFSVHSSATAFLLAIAVSACAPKAPTLPTGAGEPLAGFAGAYTESVSACRGVHTYTAVLALSGKAGRTKLRGRIEAGFAERGRMLLQGLAPFGRPVFVLTSNGSRGTLVLPRDARVLDNAPPEEIVNALAGVSLGAEQLRTIVSGCGFWPDAAPTDGRSFPNGWAAIVFPDGTAYLRHVENRWQYAAASRRTLTVFYGDFSNGHPTTIRLRSDAASETQADLTLRASQIEINTTIDPRAFVPDIPDQATPMTLDELRRAGPLGDVGR